MRIAQTFLNYNARRYSKPWIAVIKSWPIGKQPNLTFGRYIGNDKDGGEAEIDAQPGDILRWGQKDHRGNQTDNNWGIVQANGSVMPCNPEEARKLFQEQQKAKADPTAIEIGEIETPATKLTPTITPTATGAKIKIGDWTIKIPDDIEIYQGELLPHSTYGEKFKHEATAAEIDLLKTSATTPATIYEPTPEHLSNGTQQHTITPGERLCNPNDLIFIQSRAQMDFAIVDEYAEMMQAGIIFDACEGIETEDGKIYVFDGYHRGESAKKAGTMLLVKLSPGTKADAEWKAFSANIKHGLRRTHTDIERVIKNALKHQHGVNLSNREIARHCGCDEKTVRKYRAELEASAEIPQMKTRDIKRGDQEYQIEIPGAEAYFTITELKHEIRGHLSGDKKEQINYLQNIILSTAAGEAFLREIESLLKAGGKKWRKADLIAAAKHLRDGLEQINCTHCDFVGTEAQMFEKGGHWYCAKCFEQLPKAEQPQPIEGDAKVLDNLILQKMPQSPEDQVAALRKIMFDDAALQALVKQIPGFPATAIRDQCYALWERLSPKPAARDFGNCANCGTPLTGPGHFHIHPNGAICDVCARKIFELTQEANALKAQPPAAAPEAEAMQAAQAMGEAARVMLKEKGTEISPEAELKAKEPRKAEYCAFCGAQAETFASQKAGATYYIYPKGVLPAGICGQCAGKATIALNLQEILQPEAQAPIIKSLRFRALDEADLHLVIKLAKRELTRRHKPTQEGSHAANAKYQWTDGRILSVERGIGSAESYLTMYPKPNGLSWKRFVRPDLPVRESRMEAQADLDAFAKKFELAVAQEDAPTEPETAQTAADNKIAAYMETHDGFELVDQGLADIVEPIEPAMTAAIPTKAEIEELQANLRSPDNGKKRFEAIRQIDALGLKAIELLGWPTDETAWYRNLHTDHKQQLGEFLKPRDYDGSPESMFVILEHWEPTTPPEPTQKPITDAEIAAHIMRLTDAQGLSVRSVTRQLQEEGIVSPHTGKPYSKSAVDREIQKARKEGKLV